MGSRPSVWGGSPAAIAWILEFTSLKWTLLFLQVSCLPSTLDYSLFFRMQIDFSSFQSIRFNSIDSCVRVPFCPPSPSIHDARALTKYPLHLSESFPAWYQNDAYIHRFYVMPTVPCWIIQRLWRYLMVADGVWYHMSVKVTWRSSLLIYRNIALKKHL